MARPFVDRDEAGRLLGVRLRRDMPPGNVIVLGLPRGGLPVAAQVAAALDASLDVLVVRKLGAPGNEELAIGAIASGDSGFIDERAAAMLGVSRQDIADVLDSERRELARREALYRQGRPFPAITGKTVLLVDDGLATGSTMRAAVAALRTRGPAAVITAVPVGSPEACAEMAAVADRCVCLITPDPFYSVGAWYRDFSPVTDEEVLALLARSNVRRA